MIPAPRKATTMVQNLVPPGSPPLRAGRGSQGAGTQSWTGEVDPEHRLFRIQRESEVPRLLAFMGECESDARSGQEDPQRPDTLASERQERRQVVAVARVVCQATAETLLGLRPVSQLRRWLDAEVYHKVQQRSAIMARHRQGSTVHPRPLIFRSERACQPRPGCWEVTVVFSDELRTRACAMRLQAHRGRWRVVAMELG
ncbi:Rv3235 family protein [Nesterenkonia natronophila]|uniref:Uncharacterized protein n=1 Tax=Nesterenkonia natronophila TaxID=2174932 RepID=A0A3A4F5T4_9MICC|nr:Rv3235 family protein [Nesterenkonia natronophila]RJN31820.1 hypothetical protein D3250_06775 [Nesterenkonia natronophila]